MRSLRFVLFMLGAAAFAMPLAARADSITLQPSYLGNTNVSGNAGTSAPGFGSGAWQSPANGTKSESYIPTNLLFGTRTVTVADIASVSYWTNKSGTTESVDWTFYMYTNASRLNAEPYFTQTPTASVTANTWHQWSSNDAANPLKFYDAARSGTFGTYTDPTLTALQEGSVTWGNGVSHDYSGETINFFSLQTGSGWAGGFNGLVDGMTITLNTGEVGSVNLEATAAAPVPLPMAAWAGISLVGALGGFRGIKRLRAR